MADKSWAYRDCLFSVTLSSGDFECRLNPPTVCVYMGDWTAKTVYERPHVQGGDWCGHFKSKDGNKREPMAQVCFDIE